MSRPFCLVAGAVILSLVCAVLPASAESPASGAIPSAIVRISARHNHPDLSAPWQRLRPHKVDGSGVIVAAKRVLTNAHVVEDSGMLEVQAVGSSQTFTAEVAFVSHELDLALLRVPDEAFFEGTRPLELGDLPELQERVSVFGFPEGGTAASVTAGVVSRIEVERYSHSGEFFLRGQIDAAINPGNSGGPVVDSRGKIVGIAMQVRRSSENIGYMVPSPVIRHFLKDVSDGRLDGVPDLGMAPQRLDNPSLRKGLGVPDDVGGALVTMLSPHGTGSSVLRIGDVLVSYDGAPIDREGEVVLPGGLRVHCAYLEMSKQVGEPLEIAFLRDGKKQKVTVKSSYSPRFLATRAENGSPRYFVYGGLVFQPLSDQYVYSLQRPTAFPWLYTQEISHGANATLLDPTPRVAREEVVILTSVLTDELNRGYDFTANSTVWTVDGAVVRDFDDLVQKLEQGSEPFARIVTESGALIVLERSAVAQRGAAILARYGVEHDRSGALPASPVR